MTPAELEAQARQSASQGQQQYTSDINNANTYGSEYSNDTAAAKSANTNLQNYTQAMQGTYNPTTGTGNAGSAYNYELGNLEDQSGYNPAQLQAANKSLFSLTGALNGANQQFNTAGGVGAYGLTAPALASYESSILNPLQTGVSNANTQVGTLNNELGTLMTGANQFTTNTVQGQQNTMQGLNQVYQNALSQQNAALQQMQFYSQLAQQQGSLNAQQANYYASALQAYQASQLAIAQAKQAMAQTSLIESQTTGQNLQNVGSQNQLNSQAAKAAQEAAQTTSNNEYNAMGGTSTKPKTASNSGGGITVSDLLKGIGYTVAPGAMIASNLISKL